MKRLLQHARRGMGRGDGGVHKGARSTSCTTARALCKPALHVCLAQGPTPLGRDQIQEAHDDGLGDRGQEPVSKGGPVRHGKGGGEWSACRKHGLCLHIYTQKESRNHPYTPTPLVPEHGNAGWGLPKEGAQEGGREASEVGGDVGFPRAKVELGLG